jgi:hypothetical protein
MSVLGLFSYCHIQHGGCDVSIGVERTTQDERIVESALSRFESLMLAVPQLRALIPAAFESLTDDARRRGAQSRKLESWSLICEEDPDLRRLAEAEQPGAEVRLTREQLRPHRIPYTPPVERHRVVQRGWQRRADHVRPFVRRAFRPIVDHGLPLIDSTKFEHRLLRLAAAHREMRVENRRASSFIDVDGGSEDDYWWKVVLVALAGCRESETPETLLEWVDSLEHLDSSTICEDVQHAEVARPDEAFDRARTIRDELVNAGCDRLTAVDEELPSLARELPREVERAGESVEQTGRTHRELGPTDDAKQFSTPPLTDAEIAVLEAVAAQRGRRIERGRIFPEPPAPGAPKAIGKILNRLHDLGLIDCPPRKGAAVLDAGTRHLRRLNGQSMTGQ